MQSQPQLPLIIIRFIVESLLTRRPLNDVKGSLFHITSRLLQSTAVAVNRLQCGYISEVERGQAGSK